MHKDKCNTCVNKDSMNDRIKDGWELGVYRENSHPTLGYKWMHNDKYNIRVPESEIDKYESEGFVIGQKLGTRAFVILNKIEELISNLKSNNKPVNTEYYYKPDGPNSKWSYQNHVLNALRYLDILRSNDRWTEEMEAIFSRFYINELDQLKIRPLTE